MKRKIFAILLSVMCICLPLSGCKKDDNKIRLCEVTHSIFYAPLYVAINNGYFKDEGLEIELSNGGGADVVMAALTSKTADIGLMGPEATIYCHVGGQKDYPVIFGQLTRCDGSFLIGRTNEKETFDWSSLQGKKIIAGRKGGVPAMTLEYVLKSHGVTITNENFDTSVAFNLMAGTFDADKSYDYCTLFEPTASEFESAGKGFIVASVGKESGEVPYTAFSAKKSYIDKNSDKVEKFLRAVVKGYEFLRDNAETPEVVAEALSSQFPSTPLESIAMAVNSYLAINAWSDSPVMSKAAFDRLQTIMESAGELTSRADYNVAVYNDIAKKLVA